MDLSKAKRGYFVGIGGVGVNALAKFVADFGIQISGSGAKINGLCNGLIKNGAKIGKIPDFFELENADFLVFLLSFFAIKTSDKTILTALG